MFLSLEEPGGDKHVSLFARNLAGEEKFDPCRHSYTEERGNFDVAVQEVNERLGVAMGRGRHKAFSILFNQFTWPGTSGWEFWTKELVLVLRHALQVATDLKAPLHLHQDVLLKVLDGANAIGITFDWTQAKTVQKLHPGEDMAFVNRQIAKGEYYVLTNVVIPNELAMPETVERPSITFNLRGEDHDGEE